MSKVSYQEFLSKKQQIRQPTGFTLDNVDCDMLYDFQRDITLWALKLGKAALFLDCGLGKSPIQLTWAHHVCKHTGGNVLILAPLAVSKQTKREGEKFGFEVNICRSQSDVILGINITNYEMLQKFDLDSFDGIVLDESSILKSFSGKYKQEIIMKSKRLQYKLCCTATPAPNDYLELGNHAEFLDVCRSSDMLSNFFVHDGGSTQKYNLKGHASRKFWEWLSSWGLFLRDPGDIGYDNTEFKLPPIIYHEHIVESENNTDLLFNLPALTLNERRAAKRDTIEDRVAVVADMVNDSDDQWLIWCNLNDESAALTTAISDSVEVQGKHSQDYKEDAMVGFSSGDVRVLVSKPSIAGFGMNWQNCHNMAFVGLSDSFEQFYQATRRCWRFGQKETVNAHIVIADRESSIRNNISKKESAFQKMYSQTIEHTKGIIKQELKGEKPMEYYRSTSKSEEGWTMIHGDCVEELKQFEDGSFHFSIFSPPFASLYTYSNHIRDMGNNNSEAEFAINYGFLASELYRVIMPGRNVAIHCTDIPAMKERDGYIGLKDFPADIRRVMEDAGFIYHSKITIWKSPVVEVTRTKALGLLHKQIRKDSVKCRVGLPDYVIIMRKPGENPEPVDNPSEMSVDEWQKIASPVWWHISQTRTLQSIKANNDERHICPLQLDTIRDLLRLYSNPGDKILSPFAGIGSEGYQAILMGRQFIGIELKQEYYEQAIQNLHEAVIKAKQDTLLATIEKASD